jgi:hypothetical protein
MLKLSTSANDGFVSCCLSEGRLWLWSSWWVVSHRLTEDPQRKAVPTGAKVNFNGGPLAFLTVIIAQFEQLSANATNTPT